ncbi:MAG: bifunctional oligoribonuclease/PAP phosphatase NrnA [Candidatus Parcubacteria bacterium]|nr:bifunctional oligoribonuclease/PAP phosphatase NrnA [Candidatus Parcubacteria bacterium]
MIYRQTAPKIMNAIQNANHPLLISHEKPDGDTLGASLALAHYFHKNNKPHKHFCIDTPPDYFNYLPKIEKIITDYKQINLADHDLVIIIDCGNIQRTGIGQDLLGQKDRLKIINIDHHQTNDHYGHLNLVVPNASSTCEILYKFFAINKIELDKYMATSLLTGIITDTMNFTNAGTTQDCMEIASKLLTNGARTNQIIGSLNQNKNLLGLKLWGKVFSRLEYNQEFNFVYTVIAQADLIEYQMTADEASDGLSNFLSTLEDIDFIAVLTERDQDTIKGSLRTTKDSVDVSQIASLFNGGGHKKASGFKVARNMITEEIDWKNYIINAIITKLKKSEV